MFALFGGWVGEKLVSLGLAASLDRRIYRRINNLTLSTEHGAAQIDHVIVSRYGIFVVETKCMRGWISGGESDAHWTQAHFGRKDRFQNPLRQNYRHAQAVAQSLHVDHEAVHSIVFFVGDCQFETEMPPNVLTRGVPAHIGRHSVIWFSDVEVDGFERRLRDIKAHSHLMTERGINEKGPGTETRIWL